MRSSRWFVALCALMVMRPGMAQKDIEPGPMLVPDERPQPVVKGELVLGQTQNFTVPGGTYVQFTLRTETAGLLTVAARGQGGDLAIQIVDEDSQPVPYGDGDIDFGENLAAEQMVWPAPYAGSWGVRFWNIEEVASEVAAVAGFVAFASVAREPDSDGRPSLATPIALGTKVTGSLSSEAFDLSDWYRVAVPAGGRLAVFTSGDETLDVALRIVTGDDFATEVGAADNDNDGELSNETLVVAVSADTVYYIQVRLVDGSGDYRMGVFHIDF